MTNSKCPVIVVFCNSSGVAWKETLIRFQSEMSVLDVKFLWLTIDGAKDIKFVVRIRGACFDLLQADRPKALRKPVWGRCPWFAYHKIQSGAHNPEPPFPIQTLWDILSAYLSIFRNCGAFRLAHTLCYTEQCNTIRHSTTQLNTKQHNTVHYKICSLWNLSWPGVKTVLKIERYAQRLAQGYMGDGGSGWRAPAKWRCVTESYERVCQKIYFVIFC